MELYTVKNFLKSQTSDQDVASIMDIKADYNVQKGNWQSDPCEPRAYVWFGIRCLYNVSNMPTCLGSHPCMYLLAIYLNLKS